MNGLVDFNIIKDLTTVNRTLACRKRVQYLVIHYVGAEGTAKGNANYFRSTYRGASAHYFVDFDGRTIYQVVEDKDIAWHCGSPSGVYYSPCKNNTSIGIEMCCRKDAKGKWYIPKEVMNSAVSLTVHLMAKHNIPLAKVIRHYDVTHKSCPEPWVRDVSLWNTFKDKLEEALNEKLSGGEEMIVYNSLEEIPNYAKPTIEKLIKLGVISGKSSGLSLSEDMVRMFVILDRVNIFDTLEKPEVYDSMEEVPKYAKPTVEKLVDKKALSGYSQDGFELGLTEDMMRTFVILDRLNILGGD